MEIPVTEPNVISTRLGGIVSAIAADEDSSATISPSARAARISGNSAGATAAMSAALEPEMPETSIIAASNT